MAEGLLLIRKILKSVMPAAPIPISFCQTCVIVGLSTFQETRTCYMSPEKDVFDHHLRGIAPDFYLNCTCVLSNNPSKTAKEVNKGNLIIGECGKEKARNKETCKPIQCEDSGEGESSINLRIDLTKAFMYTIIRIDAREPNPDAFPFKYSVTIPEESKVFFHEEKPVFDKSWKCLEENKEAVLCHFLSNFMFPFYDCLKKPNKTQNSLVNAVAYEYGKCTSSAHN